MPIFEYQCRECEEKFEVLQFPGEDQNTVCCPKCQGGNLQRLLSPFAAGGEKNHGTSCSPSGST